MNLYDVRAMAMRLMQQHGLTDWTFCFDRAKRRLGQCRYRRKEIGVSENHARLSDEGDVRDTILHEIAHALVGPHVKSHGWEWQRKAREIGANPSRCGRVNEAMKQQGMMEANYVIECPNCGPIGHAQRMGKRMQYGSYTCRRCRTSGLKWRSK